MPTTATETIEQLALRDYKAGFETLVDQEVFPPGLDEDVVRALSAKKGEPEWLLEWRLKAFRHWLKMSEPTWANVHYSPIDYQAISYFAGPKKGPKSLDEGDPEILKTYEKLGVPLQERAMLAGGPVGSVCDSVAVATTFKAKLKEAGVLFMPFSEAVHEHPELVKKYLGSVVPPNVIFFVMIVTARVAHGPSFCLKT